MQFVGFGGVSAVIVVASVARFRAVVGLAMFAQTSCTEKQQTTPNNVKINMIDIW